MHTQRNDSACSVCNESFSAAMGSMGIGGMCLRCACESLGTEVHPILRLISLAATGAMVFDISSHDLGIVTSAGVSLSVEDGNRFRMLAILGNAFLVYRLACRNALRGASVSRHQSGVSTHLCRRALAQVYADVMPGDLMVLARQRGVVDSDGVRASIVAAVVGLVVDQTRHSTAVVFCDKLFPRLI